MILTLDSIKNNQDIIQLIFAGGLGSCLGKSIFEIGFFNFAKLPATIGDDSGEIKRPSIKAPSNISLMTTTGPDSGSGSSSEPSGSSKVPKEVIEKDSDSDSDSNASKVSGGSKAESDTYTGFLHDHYIEEFKTGYLPSTEKQVSILKKLNDKSHLLTLNVPDENKDLNVTNSELAQEFLKILQVHSSVLRTSLDNRDNFLNYLSAFLSKEDKIQIKEITLIKEKVDDAYMSKIMELAETITAEKGIDKRFLKEFFDTTNTYRNAVKKELVKMEKIVQKGIKQSNIYHEVPEFKKMLNSDYPKANKTFNDQDGYLKKRIIEILNESKK